MKTLLIIMVLGSSVMPIYAFKALYITEVIGISYLDWGLITSIFIFTTLIFSIPAGKTVDHVGRKPSLIIAFVLYSASFFSLPYSTGFYQILVIHIALAVGDSFTFTSVRSLQADYTRKEVRARVFGLFTVLRHLVMIPSSAFIGFIYEWNPVYSFQMVFIFEVLVLAIIVLFLKEPRNSMAYGNALPSS